LGSRRTRSSQGHALAWILVVIVAAGSFTAAYTFTNGFKSFTTLPTSGYTPPPSLNAGSAACLTDGLVHVVTSPGPCFNTAQFVQVHLFDQYAGSSLSGYSCVFYTLVSGTWTFAESVTNIGANGNCVTTGSYAPGTPMTVWACKDASACSSTDYAQQKTSFWTPLPPPNGLTIGAGTVSLANVPATSTPTETVNLPIIRLAGDEAASNSPFYVSVKAPNGTAIISQPNVNNGGTVTCQVNANGGAGNGCETGASTNQLTFSACYTESFQTTTYPYGLGFQSFTPVNNPTRGVLSVGNTFELKAATGTGYALPTMLSSTFTKNGQFLSSTDALYYTVPSDSSVTKTVSPSGATTNVGSTCNSITIDITSFVSSGASGNTVTLTFNLYVYFSVSFYTANGGINSEAVTQATQAVVTLNHP